mmetsp:Transcript_14063/g.20538  ORF Transcript_14063/g.20538 Transcript_14063/m.20538 type:complete len:89 (+) Transcript_14063:308-574(+)
MSRRAKECHGRFRRSLCGCACQNDTKFHEEHLQIPPRSSKEVLSIASEWKRCRANVELGDKTQSKKREVQVFTCVWGYVIYKGKKLDF